MSIYVKWLTYEPQSTVCYRLTADSKAIDLIRKCITQTTQSGKRKTSRAEWGLEPFQSSLGWALDPVSSGHSRRGLRRRRPATPPLRNGGSTPLPLPRLTNTIKTHNIRSRSSKNNGRRMDRSAAFAAMCCEVLTTWKSSASSYACTAFTFRCCGAACFRTQTCISLWYAAFTTCSWSP